MGIIFSMPKIKNKCEMTENNSKTIQNNSEIALNNLEKNELIAPVKRGRGRPPKASLPASDNNHTGITNAENKKQLSIINEYYEGHKSTCTFAGMGRALGYPCALDFISAAKKNKGNLAYALSLVEERYEKDLPTKAGATGAIFALKQVGWADTQKVETEVKAVTVNVSLAASLDDLAKVLHPVEEQTAI